MKSKPWDWLLTENSVSKKILMKFTIARKKSEIMLSRHIVCLSFTTPARQYRWKWAFLWFDRLQIQAPPISKNNEKAIQCVCLCGRGGREGDGLKWNPNRLKWNPNNFKNDLVQAFTSDAYPTWFIQISACFFRKKSKTLQILQNWMQ